MHVYIRHEVLCTWQLYWLAVESMRSSWSALAFFFFLCSTNGHRNCSCAFVGAPVLKL